MGLTNRKLFSLNQYKIYIYQYLHIYMHYDNRSIKQAQYMIHYNYGRSGESEWSKRSFSNYKLGFGWFEIYCLNELKTYSTTNRLQNYLWKKKVYFKWIYVCLNDVPQIKNTPHLWYPMALYINKMLTNLKKKTIKKS